MRNHLTKAVGLHVADAVWATIDRHLFADVSGRRHGEPRIGSWDDFNRIPGRARSHSKKSPVWETWRLVGTLDGHIASYRHPELPAAVVTSVVASSLPPGTSILSQPSSLPVLRRPATGSWWDHVGPLSVLFTGLPGGDLVLPVRLPQGAGQWARLTQFLADPGVWHKIDLLRVRDRHAPGGWRYYAHLLVHQRGFQSRSTRERRARIPQSRRAGIDANVSNISVASFPTQDPEQLVVEQVTMTAEQQLANDRAAQRARARHKALDRSRRNTNPDQYGLSVRQQNRAARRTRHGLPTKQVFNSGGARHARADGAPLHAYAGDSLSRAYQRTRADHSADARSQSQAKRSRARETAARIVLAHGNNIVAEDTSTATWARLWGKRIQLFSPGTLIRALADECDAVGGRLIRAATHTTAMSQHCLCGERVPKSLNQRVHSCTSCGLYADRDIVSAVLAACVKFDDASAPETARVDYRLAHALRAGLASQQEARAQSTGTGPRRLRAAASARVGSHQMASAKQGNHQSAHPRTDRLQNRTSRKQPKESHVRTSRFGGSTTPQVDS